MRNAMQALLAAMLAIAGTALIQARFEEGLLILVLFAFSARAYLLVRHFKESGDKDAYAKQMKAVQVFTVACGLLSFYWPGSMYCNASLASCLMFHILADHAAKRAARESD